MAVLFLLLLLWGPPQAAAGKEQAVGILQGSHFSVGAWGRHLIQEGRFSPIDLPRL